MSRGGTGRPSLADKYRRNLIVSTSSLALGGALGQEQNILNRVTSVAFAGAFVMFAKLCLFDAENGH